jgi:hypothetical protein
MQARRVSRRLVAVSACVFTMAFAALLRAGFIVHANSAAERIQTSVHTPGDRNTDRAEAIEPNQKKRARSQRLEYMGDQKLVGALATDQVRGRSIASADLNDDAAPDLVTGYSYSGGGIVTIQLGNLDAFAPNDESVFERMQNGYNPDALQSAVIALRAPEPPDFLQIGDFDGDNRKDVLLAARGGNLYLLPGDGQGRIGKVEHITLPGAVTALTSGEFRAADGRTDVAVGILGLSGPQLMIFDGAEGLFNSEGFSYFMPTQLLSVEFGEMDDDPFMDLAVLLEQEIYLVHGWGRKTAPTPESRLERVRAHADARGMALGHFIWDREGRKEIATLAADGTATMLQSGNLDTRPFTRKELSARNRGRFRPQASASVDVESVQGWEPSGTAGWTVARTALTHGFADDSARQVLIAKTNLASRETEDLMIAGAGKLISISQIDEGAKAESMSKGKLIASTADMAEIDFAPVDAAEKVLELPQKLNGERNLVILKANIAAPDIVALAPTNITVDRTDDPSGAALAAASVCGPGANDCSLRGAFQFANNPANSPATINLPAGTYVLSTNGTSQGGCDGNAVGDLGANQSTNILGAGAATTVIRQTGTGPANDGDRVMCMNEPFTIGLTYSFSGVTFVGGREGSAAGAGTALGGAGIIGGELNNSLTLTSVVMANNQETVAGSANLGGGALQITGGNLIITNSTFGGTNVPGLYTDRANTNTGNTQAGSGGGITYTPSSPQHAGGTGTLTVTGSTFSRNTAAGIGGGAADLLIFAFAAPGGIGSGSASISTSNFLSNQGLGTASGGGLIVESLPTAVATTNFTSNSAGNRGGATYVGGGSLLLDGSGAGVTMSGNTAANGGTSISTAAPVNVSGSGVTLGGSIEVSTGGIWTNNAGSTVSPTDVVVTGGTFNMNNSTMNVVGNLTVGPAAIVGATFNGNTGTVNIAGNLVTNSGGAGPATTFNGGGGTFNFNGAGSQSISGSLSPTFGNLTDSNTSQPLAINSSIVVNGTLNVNGANATLAPAAASVISGTGTLTGNGTARVTRTAATAGFVNQYTITNRVLTNLLVDYVGASAQVLSAVTYGPLRINNASGVNLAAGTSTVDGLLTLTSGALGVGTNTLVINNGTSVGAGSITSAVTGTVSYNQGSAGQDVRAFNYGNLTFSNQNKVLANGGTIGIAGAFTPGTAVGHTISGSTINFNGGGAQTIPAFNYNNLASSGTGARTLANVGAIGVAGTFTPSTNAYTITSSTIDFNGAGAQSIPTFNYNNLTSSNVGARTLANAGTIGIESVFTPGTNTYTITGSTINFNGNVAQAIPAFNFNNLTSSGTGARTLPNGGTVRIAGAFAPGTNVYTITGSTVEHNGSALQTIPAFTYNNFVLNNVAGANLGGNVTIDGSLALTIGALNVLTNTLTLNGAATATGGSFTSSATGTVNYNQGSAGQGVLSGNYGNMTFSNSQKNLTNANIGIANVFTPGTFVGHTIAGSTFIYNGTSPQTLPAGFAIYNNLTLNNTAGVTGFAGLTVQDLLRIQAGTFTSSSTYNNVQIDAGATLAGVAATTINVAGNWTNNGTFNANGNTLNFNGSSAQTIGGSSTTTFNNLTINNSAGVGLGGNATVGGALLITSGAFNVNSSTLTINAGSSSTGGTLASGATGTVVYAQGTNGQTVLAANYGNLTFSNFNKTLPAVGTVGIAGAFTPGTALGHTTTGSTIDFNGTGAQTVAAFSYNNLAISGARGGATVTLSSGNINVAGVFSPTATGVLYGVAGNTFSFNGGGDQTISAFIYNNLATATGGTKTLGGNASALGSLNVASGTLLDCAGFNLAVGGNWQMDGGFVCTTGTVIFNGVAAQTIGGTSATTFNNLTINNANGVNLGANATVGGTLTLTAGVLGVGANTLTLNNGLSVGAGSLSSATAGTVNYNQGTNGQVILSANYGNLTFSNLDKNLSNVTIGIAGMFTPGTSLGHMVAGSTITFNGTASQTVPVFPYDNLTVNNAAGVSLIGNTDIGGTLTLQNGIVNAGDFTLNVTATGSATRAGTCTLASCFVTNNPSAGGVRKQFGAGATSTFVYPVGTSGGTDNGYSPVELANITAASAGDSLAVRAVDAVSPAPIVSEKITRYWELTESGGITTDITFRYLAGDDDSVTVPSALAIFRGSGPVCSSACVDEVNFSGTITGVTEFSPWTFAVLVPTAANVSISGRVVTENGRGINKARLTLMGSDGQARTALTNQFGHYRFVDVAAGQTYILSVSAKRYTFTEPTMVLNVLEELTDVNFVGTR